MSGKVSRRAAVGGLAAVAAASRLRGAEMDERWAAWWRAVGEDLAAGVAPGCGCVIEHRGRRVVEAIWGRAQVEPEPVELRPGMRWDMASLTKAMATTSCALALYEDGRLDLDAPVTEHLPDLLEHGGEEKSAVTARHLLTHSAGFPAWIRFYRNATSRLDVRQRLFRTPLEAPPGRRCTYSDLGFMTLGFLIEAVSGETEDRYLRRRILEPNGLEDDLGFNPPDPTECVATERCAWRGRVVRGEVHDENAAACDGVAGHAGLFATLDGAARFGSRLAAGGIFAAATRSELFRKRDDAAGHRFWLGWTRHDYETGDSSAYGHTGFTGTLLWTSPARELVVCLLTNRVHPTRSNSAIGTARPRWVRTAWDLAGA